MLNLGYDMFDELRNNMVFANRFAQRINCEFLQGDVEDQYTVFAVNDIRFEIDETSVEIIVNFSYGVDEDYDSVAGDTAKENTYRYVMDDELQFHLKIKWNCYSI